MHSLVLLKDLVVMKVHKGLGLERDLGSERPGGSYCRRPGQTTGTRERVVEEIKEREVEAFKVFIRWNGQSMASVEWSEHGFSALVGTDMPVCRAVSEFHLTTLAILPQFLDCSFRLMPDS